MLSQGPSQETLEVFHRLKKCHQLIEAISERIVNSGLVNPRALHIYVGIISGLILRSAMSTTIRWVTILSLFLSRDYYSSVSSFLQLNRVALCLKENSEDSCRKFALKVVPIILNHFGLFNFDKLSLSELEILCRNLKEPMDAFSDNDDPKIQCTRFIDAFKDKFNVLSLLFKLGMSASDLGDHDFIRSAFYDYGTILDQMERQITILPPEMVHTIFNALESSNLPKDSLLKGYQVSRKRQREDKEDHKIQPPAKRRKIDTRTSSQSQINALQKENNVSCKRKRQDCMEQPSAKRRKTEITI